MHIVHVPFLLNVKRLPIKVYWEDKRFPRVPENRNAIPNEGRGKKDLEDLLKCRNMYSPVHRTMRKIAVTTIDVAEWRRLDNNKLCLH
jgi:hypothetical protein